MGGLGYPEVGKPEATPHERVVAISLIGASGPTAAVGSRATWKLRKGASAGWLAAHRAGGLPIRRSLPSCPTNLVFPEAHVPAAFVIL